MNKILISAATIAGALALSAGSVSAAGTTSSSVDCQPIYGGGKTCVTTPEFEINKLVINPQTNTFVDNLGISNPRFAPDQEIVFKLVVRNTSNTELKNLVVKDIFPEHVVFLGGDGNFDAGSRTFSFTIPALGPGETREFLIKTKAVAKDKLPNDREVACFINQAFVTLNDKTSQDNAQFCIEKEVVVTPGQPGVPVQNPPTTKGGLPVFPPSKNVTTTPQTGPEAIALIGLIPSAIGGIFLRRKSK